MVSLAGQYLSGTLSLSICERYPRVIRRLYNRVRSDRPSITDEYALDVSLKSLNDTVGVDDLTLTL